MDVERGADAEQRRRLQAADVSVHPAFLLGRAESDPHEIRLGRVDPGHDLVVLLGRQWPKRR